MLKPGTSNPVPKPNIPPCSFHLSDDRAHGHDQVHGHGPALGVQAREGLDLGEALVHHEGQLDLGLGEGDEAQGVVSVA